MKKCPYCAEEIQDEAKICRFCNRSLNVGTTPDTTIKSVNNLSWVEATLIMFKESPQKIKIITLFNLISFVLGFLLIFIAMPFFSAQGQTESFLPGFLEHCVWGAVLLGTNYYLLKKNIIAYYLMLLWYFIQVIHIKQFYGFYYSLYFNITFGDLGFNILAIIMFFVLLQAKDYFSLKQ